MEECYRLLEEELQNIMTTIYGIGLTIAVGTLAKQRHESIGSYSVHQENQAHLLKLRKTSQALPQSPAYKG